MEGKGTAMRTDHRIVYGDSNRMDRVESKSVDLVVTSPPYPMIEMWDNMFSLQDASVAKALKKGAGADAFERMHRVLDRVWGEVYRVLKPGGFACINIGDATRTINGNFVLYTNHSRILQCTLALGFTALPCVLWRKQTNAPNKFMGSGMLPAGAYVTLEHEYVLVLRKGPKRVFGKENQKMMRRESAFFWEERNAWFSDVWFDIKGTPQGLNDKDARKRSAAFPFELVYRLINMYAAKNDTVLDPFLGTGTTTFAAMASGRNSIGYDIDSTLENTILKGKGAVVETAKRVYHRRLRQHIAFVVQRLNTKGGLKYDNMHYGFPVITNQEKMLLFNDPINVTDKGRGSYAVDYLTEPQPAFCKNWSEALAKDRRDTILDALDDKRPDKNFNQMPLF